jgi:hypothetical protein
VLAPPAFARTEGPAQLSLAWPASGALTSPFGWDGGRPHSGLDIGILRSLEVRAAARGVVNCGSGIATTFNDLVVLLNAVLGTRRTIEYFENPHVGRYQSHTECDMRRARERLGFVPAVGIREGIERYVASGALVPLRQPGDGREGGELNAIRRSGTLKAHAHE